MRIDIALGAVTTVSALLGAAMSAHPPVTARQKRSWMSAFIILGILGMGLVVLQSEEAIKSQRAADRAQGALVDSLNDVRRSSDENRRLTESSTRLQRLNTDLQRQLLVLSGHIAAISKTTLENVVGKDSYAYVVPQDHGATEESIPLAIHNAGKHILSGVTIRIMRISSAADFANDAANGEEIAVGTLYPEEARMLPGHAMRPRIDAPDGVDEYWLHISSQAGLISEVVSFRRRRDGKLPWAYEVRVSRVEFRKGGSATLPLIYRDWSDATKK